MVNNAILLVEDDTRIQWLLQTQLEQRGFKVCAVGSGPEGLASVAESMPDLVLLDIALPGMDGLAVCRELRRQSSVPVIFITSDDSWETREAAMECGGDDYLVKPFHPADLVARIDTILRRAGAIDASASDLVVGDLRLDLVLRKVFRHDMPVTLTEKEYNLLYVLVRQVNRVLTYRQLLDGAQEPGRDDIRSLHLQICGLRRKIEGIPGGHRHIIAEPGIGYRFRE